MTTSPAGYALPVWNGQLPTAAVPHALHSTTEFSDSAARLTGVTVHAIETPGLGPLSLRPAATAPALFSGRDEPAWWCTHSLTPTVIIISAHGNIDASNVGELTDYTRDQPTMPQGLIVDLRGVNFFAIEGFSALLTISTALARTGTVWALVPGAAASRVLRICDPQHELPVGTVETALALFGQQHLPPRRSAADAHPLPSAG
jgi:hypothetical protein